MIRIEYLKAHVQCRENGSFVQVMTLPARNFGRALQPESWVFFKSNGSAAAVVVVVVLIIVIIIIVVVVFVITSPLSSGLFFFFSSFAFAFIFCWILDSCRSWKPRTEVRGFVPTAVGGLNDGRYHGWNKFPAVLWFFWGWGCLKTAAITAEVGVFVQFWSRLFSQLTWLPKPFYSAMSWSTSGKETRTGAGFLPMPGNGISCPKCLFDSDWKKP